MHWSYSYLSRIFAIDEKLKQHIQTKLSAKRFFLTDITAPYATFNSSQLTIYTNLMFNDYTENDPCLSSPCKNEGVCTKTSGTTFSCECVNGFTGADCSNGILAYVAHVYTVFE